MERWDVLRRVLLGEDAELRRASGRAWTAMWEHNPQQLCASGRVAPPEMWDYLQRAQQAAGRR